MVSPLLALALFSAAHLDALAGREPFVVDGALVGGATTWGLVLRDLPSDPFLRVCEEATGGAALIAHRVPDGRVLVATANGLISSGDGGCSWAPVDSMLGNLEVSTLVGAQNAPAIAYLATSRAGAPNGVWKSIDGGATFTETALAGTINPLLELAVSDDGARVVVSGFDLDGERPLLRASLDGGASFTEASFDLASISRVKVLAVDDAGEEPRVWLALFDLAEVPTLASADLQLSSVRVEGTFETDAVALVPFAGAHFALVRPGALYRRAADSNEWTNIDDVTLSCLRTLPGDERLWGCTVTPAQFAVSTDGLAWTPMLGADEIEERTCPADSYAALVCARPVEPQPVDEVPDLPPIAPVDDPPADAPDVAVDDVDAPRGCASASTAPLLWALLAFARRRR